MMNNLIKPSLNEYLPNPKSYLALMVCTALGTFLFSFPQTAMELAGLTQTPGLENTIRFVVPLLLILFGLALAHVLSVLHFHSSTHLNSWKFDQKIILTVGEYFDIRTESAHHLRVELKKISKEKMPPPDIFIPYSKDNDIITETATIMFSPAVIYPGRCVKKIENYSGAFEETFVLPKYKYPEEDTSVYFFNVTNSTNGAKFFRCHVEHINENKQQVELEVYYSWSERNRKTNNS